MKILLLNGIPRPHGNTAAMAEAFARGARENGNQVDMVHVCRKKIAGCLACEYCHQKDSGHERQCVQQDDMQEIFSEITGKQVDQSFVLFPPFYTDCGKNIAVGKNVFINSGCRFQDQGGITIGDGTLIGHCVVLATLNHGICPEERHDLFPAPIHIGGMSGSVQMLLCSPV